MSEKIEENKREDCDETEENKDETTLSEEDMYAYEALIAEQGY